MPTKVGMAIFRSTSALLLLSSALIDTAIAQGADEQGKGLSSDPKAIVAPNSATKSLDDKKDAAAPAQSKSAVGEAKANEPNLNDPNIPKAGSSTNIFAEIITPFDYEVRGRRDPFASPSSDKPLSQGSFHGPTLPLQKFDLSQLSLVAIIWNVDAPKAMIKDPEGKVYIVSPNAKIGMNNGYIASIREGEIVVVETTEQDGRLVSTAQVVKIAK